MLLLAYVFVLLRVFIHLTTAKRQLFVGVCVCCGSMALKRSHEPWKDLSLCVCAFEGVILICLYCHIIICRSLSLNEFLLEKHYHCKASPRSYVHRVWLWTALVYVCYCSYDGIIFFSIIRKYSAMTVWRLFYISIWCTAQCQHVRLSRFH